MMLINILPENRYVRYMVYSVGFALLTEVCHGAYKFGMRFYRQKFPAAEIADVLFFNELSESCAQFHVAEKSANNRKPNHLSLSKELTCENLYCAVRNLEYISKLLESATYSIDVAIYTFTSYTLFSSFKRALNKGVTVRIISDREMAYSSGSQISKLADYGVAVRGPSTTYMMHHKFCVIDAPSRVMELLREKHLNKEPRKYHTAVLSGSANWTKQGSGGNWENIFITRNLRTVESYHNEFSRMWKAFELKQTKN